MNLNRFRKKLIIAKDAGAANMIYSYLKSKNQTFYCYLKHPADKIFNQRNFIRLKNIKNLKQYDLLITGTSVKNKLELTSIVSAKKLGIYSVTFLDHWTNYKKRFLLKKKITLPNEIIAFDSTSFFLAKKIFNYQIIKKSLILSKVNNPYFKIVKSKKKNNLLILSSNYDILRWKKIKDKKILFNFFKKNHLFFKNKKINNYFLKNHPSENKKKFISLIKKVKKEFNIDLKVVNKDLKKLTKTIKHVVGYNSMALVIAKLSGCVTYEIKISKVKSDVPNYFIKKYI